MRLTPLQRPTQPALAGIGLLMGMFAAGLAASTHDNDSITGIGSGQAPQTELHQSMQDLLPLAHDTLLDRAQHSKVRDSYMRLATAFDPDRFSMSLDDLPPELRQEIRQEIGVAYLHLRSSPMRYLLLAREETGYGNLDDALMWHTVAHVRTPALFMAVDDGALPESIGSTNDEAMGFYFLTNLGLGNLIDSIGEQDPDNWLAQIDRGIAWHHAHDTLVADKSTLAEYHAITLEAIEKRKQSIMDYHTRASRANHGQARD